MNVSLTDELEQFITEKVKSGWYTSASEVIRDSLRLLVERDQLYQIRLEELRKEIQKGLESGPTMPFEPEAILNKVRTRMAQQTLQE